MMQPVPLQKIQSILRNNSVIAVVGLSPRESRPSHQVAHYMQHAGYRIIPVNPGHDEILGEPCYPDLRAVPHQVDIVNIFRRSDQVEPVVHDAIAIHARIIWMQQGIVNPEAAQIAEENGLDVIMDRCIKIDHQDLMSSSKNDRDEQA
jgi:predicted CoA-binding protein